jgi:hypothetical protein
MAKGGRLAIIFSLAGLVQIDKDTPLDLGDLDTRLTVTSRNYVNTEKTIENIFNCIKEEIVSKEVTRIIRRLPVEGEFCANAIAPFGAYLLGQAAAPTGSKVQGILVVTVSADAAGKYRLTLNYDGITAQSGYILVGATAADFKYAIEQMDNIGFGNTTVVKTTPAATVYTVTFGGKRANAPIPNFSVDSALITAGTVTPTRTATGSQRVHNLSELTTEYQPPYTSIGVMFEDESGSERVMVGACIDNLRLQGANGNGKVTFSMDIISRDLIVAPGLVVPACYVCRPIRTADCLFNYDNTDYSSNMLDFDVSYSNGLLTGDSAYTGRGVKPSRLNRALQRTRSMNVGILGGVTNALYHIGEQNPEANVIAPAYLRIGTDGNNLQWNYPNSLLELTSGRGGIDFQGETEDAIDRFSLTATNQGATPPSNIAAEVDQSAVFLG